MRKISICENCCGNGEVVIRNMNNEREVIDCRFCNGTGRLLSLSYSIDVSFDFDDEKLLEADRKIFDIIHNLKVMNSFPRGIQQQQQNPEISSKTQI